MVFVVVVSFPIFSDVDHLNIATTVVIYIMCSILNSA